MDAGASAASGLLDVTDLSFTYRGRGRQVLQALEWSIATSEKVALLGPNGAGKSTFMKLLSGVLTPTGGAVWLQGQAVSRRELARTVARMPQHATALPRLNARDQVTYAGWLGGIPERLARERADHALDVVDLHDERGTSASALSGGQLRRLGLAETLVRETPVVLLDEPTAGLDPEQRQRFRRVLTSLSDTALVVATHETHDIADLFDRVTVLLSGRVCFDGEPEKLLTDTSTDTIEAAYTVLVAEHAG